MTGNTTPVKQNRPTESESTELGSTAKNKNAKAADDVQNAKPSATEEKPPTTVVATSSRARRRDGLEDVDPHVIVLFGATGDLAQRKLLPGLAYLAESDMTPDIEIVGTSLADMSDDDFRQFTKNAIDAHGSHSLSDEQWADFSQRLHFVATPAGPQVLSDAVKQAQSKLGKKSRILHYMSVPPNAAPSVLGTIEDARLVADSRVIMEKPFGTDLQSSIALNNRVHRTFKEDQVFRIDHFLGKEAALNILAFRFANGLFEPIWNRNFIDNIQIDVPESLGLDGRTAFYEPTGAYRDMVVTHLFQVLAFVAMEPPTALDPRSIGEEKDKVFRSMESVRPYEVVRGQYSGYRNEPGVAPDSDTETFVALRVRIDNWRWSGIPFYLRTGKKMAEGMRIISIAFKEAPKSMFTLDSGIASYGPDHLTFDLADETRISLSFYGKRPGPGIKLDKQSMQFSTADTDSAGDVLEAYERLILDAMRGDHTLFVSAEGIENLWANSQDLLDNPPPVKPYQPDSWGPNAVHQLIAPHAWRLPFERGWRTSKS